MIGVWVIKGLGREFLFFAKKIIGVQENKFKKFKYTMDNFFSMWL